MLDRTLGALRARSARIVRRKVLLPVCLRTGAPKNRKQCKELVEHPLDAGLVRSYAKARRYYKDVDPDKVTLIRVLSYSRSGSHNFFSRIHYLDSCFVLRENLYARRTTDPMRQLATPRQLAALDYMAFSMFGRNGLQEKSGDELRCLVSPFNKLLEFPLEKEEDPFPAQGRVVFFVRNFFRMLMSRDDAARKLGKEKWLVDDATFFAWIDAHHRNLSNYAHLMRSDPGRFLLLGHEVFCARPREVFAETMGRLGIEDAAWAEPEAFFTRCLDGRSKPVVKNNQLWDASAGRPIVSNGGYNPLLQPSLGRTLNGDVAAFVRKSWIDYAEKLFGPALVELWLSDTPETYERMTADEHAALMQIA